MNVTPQPWDYLIVTASNDIQAKAYQRQLAMRQALGKLAEFGHVMVVADPQGKRVGSGGSTIFCLLEVLDREFRGTPAAVRDAAAIVERLARRRILILHAGGDSKRLPAYGPCGKIFVPVPGESRQGLAPTVFEHLLETFLRFPAAPAGCGQVVVAAGDALVRFDPTAIELAPDGLTALGVYAPAAESSKHGVFCAAGSGPVRRFLQKPSPVEQAQSGALSPEERSILDVGVMSFGAAAAAAMLAAGEVGDDGQNHFAPSAAMNDTIMTKGLDLYREMCCALGSEATVEHLLASARASGSAWPDAMLRKLHAKLNPLPFHVRVLATCSFLHFGTTKQLIGSGAELLRQLTGKVPPADLLCIRNAMLPGGSVSGPDSWVEACRIAAPLQLAGQNVVVGVDIDQPLRLPAGACLDVLAGHDRQGRPVRFVRCYHVNDTFKGSVAAGGTFWGRPLLEWLSAVGVSPQDVWDAAIAPQDRSLWDARVFPAVANPGDYRHWLWTFDPATPSPAQQRAFLAADRYSMAEMTILTDQDAFHARRSSSDKPSAGDHDR